ncbi:DUF7660 family protein [Streptomyces thermoalcalitolerans]|uniref:DUF7660 domain-containing protein n=1 Tax=Streptomyces thermoalcalitolerans TaxID=65605 RepID=A0ABP3YVD1_9ACTN
MNWHDEALNQVQSREDLADYLARMAEMVRSGDMPAENITADSLIDAAARWTRSMDGFFKNIVKEPVPEEPDWSMIAAIFHAALIYE